MGRVSQKLVDDVMARSDYVRETKFGKCAVVTMRLPNGFVLVESSACADPGDYDEGYGWRVCTERLKGRVWELYGFLAQEEGAATTAGL